MRTPVVVTPDSLTSEQFAKRLGIPRKRFLELKAIADQSLADVAAKGAAKLGMTVPEFFEYIKKSDSTLGLEDIQPQESNASPRIRNRHASKRT